MNSNPERRGMHALEGTGERPPGSRFSRRQPSNRGFPAPSWREESGPPTQPSIAPPAARGSAHRSEPAASPLAPFEKGAPRLSQRLSLVLVGVALALGGLWALSLYGRAAASGWAASLWMIAVATLVFCLAMAVLITHHFARRLEALAEAAARVAPREEDKPPSEVESDPIKSLAHSLALMTRRIELLNAELTQCVEEERARVDELVRERTRELGREAADCRRALGPGRGLLSVDLEGRILGQAPSVIAAWLGPAPPLGSLWDYFEHVSQGAGAELEAAWRQARRSGERLRVNELPADVALGRRQLALKYEIVSGADGGPERVLVLVSDVTIPEPDPASSVDTRVSR